MKAEKHQIIHEAKYLMVLTERLLAAAENSEENGYGPCRQNGTIKNLAPEISKLASKINKMTRYGWEGV